MSRVPARVAQDAESAMADIAALAEAAAQTPPAANDPPPADPGEPAGAPAPAPAPAAPAPTATPVDPLAELRRMNDNLATMAGRLDAVNRDNQRLQQELLAARNQPPAQPPAPPPSLVTDKDREEYGEDMLGMVERVIQQTVGTQLRDLGTRLAGLEGRIGSVSTRVQQVAQVAELTAEQKYRQDLDSLVPGWEEVNKDQNFLDWLQEKDTLSGKKRFDLLLDAHENLESGRVAFIFKLYKPELGNAPQAAGTPSNPEPQSGAPAPIIDPATLAAPATSPNAAPPASPAPGKVWTQAEVDDLYDAKSRKRISAAEFQKREAEYFQALREGRVAAA